MNKFVPRFDFCQEDFLRVRIWSFSPTFVSPESRQCLTYKSNICWLMPLVFHKPLILLHQRANRLKTTITENNQIWSHEPQLFLTQWNYELCCVGLPKTNRSWWRVLTKCHPLEKGMANHFSILALRTPWTEWKIKKIGHWKMNSLGW